MAITFSLQGSMRGPLSVSDSSSLINNYISDNSCLIDYLC